jgi:cholesterol transport system auxiliary component
MMKSLVFGALALAFPALALTGCVNVLPKAQPASPRFTIAPVEFQSDAAPAVDWTLIVEDPQASRVYDSTKIALVREPQRIEFYADGEWADRPPRLIQSALIRSFENTGRILGVGDRTTRSIGDFALQTDIRRLEADVSSGEAKAVFSVYARLVNNRGKVIAAKLFTREGDAESDRGPAVAKAIDVAAQGVIADIVAWAFENAQKAASPKS